MDTKKLRFHIYRYHLSPVSSNDTQLKLFDEPEKFTAEEIREKKNEFFKQILDDLPTSPNSSNPLQLHENEEQFYIFKFANKKSATITQNFKNVSIENEPYVYVIINNDDTIQKIAISENTEAFSNPNVVKNLLLKLFRKDLMPYKLNVSCEAIFSAVDFWEYVESKKDKITLLDFKYIKPNLANISGSIPKAFRAVSDSYNSHESHLKMKAPDNGILENITKDDKDINGLVDYVSEGAGSIRIKSKGIRKIIDTKEKHVTHEIDEIEIEGVASYAIKAYKEIVS